MAQAYISLLSNFGDRKEYLNRSIWAIHALPQTKVVSVGRVYETELQGEKPKNFYVAAARIETALSPEALLGALHGIEAAMGRNRKGRECVIDLDLLNYENEERNTNELHLPHKELLNRPHILAALLSIYADKTYKTRLQEIDNGKTRVTGEGLYMPL